MKFSFAPLVIVGDHLRPEECLYAEPNALDLGEQQTKNADKQTAGAEKAEDLIQRHSVTSVQP